MELKNIIKEDFKHSFSSVSKFRKNPSEWLVHYGLGLKSPSSPAMTRGSLAEKGTNWLIKREKKMLSTKNYEKNIRKLFEKSKFLNAESEVENAIAIGKKFTEELYKRQLRDIVSYQKEKVENIVGLKYPVRLFTDFEYEHIIVDLKSTLRLPKKSLWYELSEQDIMDGYQELINDFKSLENYINMCKNNLEEAIKITPLNTDPNPFSWDNNIKQEAIKIWQKINK
jgi:hypothetical protein